jgi:hypothetical protein
LTITRPLLGTLDGGDHLHQGRLAGAGRAGQVDQLALGDVEGDLAQA